MKKTLLFASLLAGVSALAQEKAINPGNMKTRWAADVTPANAWREYPRPQMVRTDWANLNGLWEYAIRPKAESQPASFDGKILVPYCVESSLSGVGKMVTPEQKLWYRNKITVPANWKGKKILLHFDAVDWETTVWINGKIAGTHKGGNDPFTFDITSHLQSGQQEIVLSVWDPTDTYTQPRGKQVLKPHGIWYTAVTGIWQSVWMEPVEKAHIEGIVPVADIDHNKVTINSEVLGASGAARLAIKVFKNKKLVAQKTVPASAAADIAIPSPSLWTPQSPSLYQLQVELLQGGKTVDKVSSYFAMRKTSIGKDALGYMRLMLNNKPVFQYGTLDQGWWPDGLLTPPSDKAMRYDIDMLKKMGFNMLRKHIKVEPSRYYFYADSIGMLVWQDMPSGMDMSDLKNQLLKFDAPDWKRPAESAVQFEAEWKNIMDHLRFFPSIVVWVPFNEGWGQYDTERVVKWTKQYDPSRVINATSGWVDRGVGDMNDAHHYPGPGMEPAPDANGRVVVLGEFGGLGLPVMEHIWNPGMRNWGYRTYKSTEELQKQYTDLMHNMVPMVSNGLSAAVYTQTTDVEGEVNGLMTYDRAVNKMDPAYLSKIHAPLYAAPVKTSVVFADSETKPHQFLIADSTVVDTANVKMAKGKMFTKITGPYTIKKGESKWAMKLFDLKEVPKQVQLRIFARGDVNIYLNGQKVVSKYIGCEHHYDEINLSNYSQYLKKGDNKLLIRISNAKNEHPFDIGMYSL